MHFGADLNERGVLLICLVVDEDLAGVVSAPGILLAAVCVEVAGEDCAQTATASHIPNKTTRHAVHQVARGILLCVN